MHHGDRQSTAARKLGLLISRAGDLFRAEGHSNGASEPGAPSPVPVAPQPDFGEQLGHELERSRRGARPLSVMIGQLIGQSLSAPAGGERALTVVAAAVGAQKRRIDTLAIIDDERFGLILPDTGEQGALVLAGRLRAAIAAAFADRPDAPAVNFGIAAFPRHGRTPEALTSAADRALRAVKTLGDNRDLLDSLEAPATVVSINGSGLSEQRIETLLALAETVDVRDQGNAWHSQAVGRYAEQIGRELGFPVKRSDHVRLAGLLHDVGKIAVPEAVLRKSGPLDEHEWERVRQHAELGARLIDDPGLADVRDWVLAHHERPDGTGYPLGLAGDQIPLEARIVAVADAYESMTSDRPYRAALSHETAQAELVSCSDSQFDRRVVDAFLRVLEREGLRTGSRAPVS
jgi:diguanylate cyclase (GGDEF)-like protein/putative nucleotidyltransferase with HDIG domain